MQTIQEHFRAAGRDPTDWSWRRWPRPGASTARTRRSRAGSTSGRNRSRRYDNLLKETIFAATQEIRRRLGADDWCVSVFEDNAGVVRFDDEHDVCFKVETHNHPSAIDPYGGANTGLGGVIRDPLGTGLGAKPICNTDVFCFAPPDTPPESLPPGVLHPLQGDERRRRRRARLRQPHGHSRPSTAPSASIRATWAIRWSSAARSA